MTTPTTISDVFAQAADLIEPEGAWIRFAEAKDAEGNLVARDDPAACRFCASGAINRVLGIKASDSPYDHPLFEPTRQIFLAVAGEYPMPFNDAPERKQSEVVGKLREAAIKVREELSK